MKYLINIFLKNRDAFALAFFFAGIPIVYFFRDGLLLAPDSTIFSMGFIFLPFALTIPFKNFRYFDSPNKVTFPLLIYYIIYLFAYFYLKDRELFTVSFTNEILTFGIIVFVALCITFMRNNGINEVFIRWGLVLTFLSSLALIYYVLQNPIFALGRRAAFISNSDSVGNAHINSKAAFFGVIFCMIALKHYNKVKMGLIFPIIVLISCFVILVLTQTMIAILATFAFFVVFLVFNFTVNNAINTFRFYMRKWYVVLFVFVGIGGVTYKVIQNSKFLEPALKYVDMRAGGLKKSLFGGEEKKKSIVKKNDGDDSANTRIAHINGAFSRLEKSFDEGDLHYVLFGQGYKFMYLDVPILESLDSMGLVGLLFYSLVFFRICMMCFRELRNPDNIGTEFLAYAFIYFFFMNFTAGQLVDYIRLSSYFIFCRFLLK